MNKSILSAAILLISLSITFAQAQFEVESNSSSSSPQLLLKETESSDFVRLWFKNNEADKWGFNAKPQSGSFDADNILPSPIILAHNGAQIFGVGSNGTIRINKKYTLPNIDGLDGQVLTTNGAGVASWQNGGNGSGSLWQTSLNNAYRSSGNVGIGTSTPEVKLEVTGAIKLEYEDPSSPVEGTIRWNPTVGDFEGYDGSQWRSMTKCSTTGNSNTGGLSTTPMCCEEYHVASDIVTAVGRFGSQVAIHGQYAAVTDGYRSLYIFEYDGTKWIEILKDQGTSPSPSNGFGSSVAIHGDWIVVGAKDNGNGQVHLYKKTNGNWAENSIISPSGLTSDAEFGYACAIYGDNMVVSAVNLDVVHNHNSKVNQGAVYLYENINDTWTETGKFTIDESTSDTHFGTVVDISHQHIVVSSEVKGSIRTTSTGKAYVYKKIGNSWGIETILGAAFTIDDRFGKSVALDNNTMVIGAHNTGNGTSSKLGRVYIYNYDNNNWTLTDTLTSQASADFFGSSIDVAGDYIMVGRRLDLNDIDDAGGVEIFHFNNGWNYNRTIMDQLPSEDAEFGHNPSGGFSRRVATDGVNLIIGSPKAEANGYIDSGRVVFGPID